MKIFFLIAFLSLSLPAFSHEHHDLQDTPATWLHWIGSLHLIFLHFPIALINMLVISEVLLAWLKKPIFEFSSQFLVNSAALLSAPTALLGFIFSYAASYDGLTETFLMWHMWLGIATAILAIALAFMRPRIGATKLYSFCLFTLFLTVNLAAFFGGEITFGLYVL